MEISKAKGVKYRNIEEVDDKDPATKTILDRFTIKKEVTLNDLLR